MGTRGRHRRAARQEREARCPPSPLPLWSAIALEKSGVKFVISKSSLYLIIQVSGAKSWAQRFRKPNGKPAKLTLGPVELTEHENADEPVFGAPLSLRAARQLAAKIDRERARGVDVIAEFKVNQERRRNEHESRAANSFGSAVIEFYRDYKTRWGARPRRWRSDARLLGLVWPKDADPKKVEPEVVKGSLAQRWRDTPVAAIDDHAVFLAVKEAAERSASTGRKTHAALSLLFRWLKRHRKITGPNPTIDIPHPAAPPARQRALTNDEIRWLWTATGKIAEPFGAAVRLLLLSGCRLNEVVGMRRNELDHNGTVGDWSIAPDRVKNHRPHLLPLAPLAQEIVNSVPIIESDAGLVFTTNGRSKISGWSKAKRALDVAMLAIAKEENPRATIAPWRLHDLRRTADTGMHSLSIAPHIVSEVLNHVSQGAKAGMGRIYNQYSFYPEKKASLVRWSQHIANLVSGEASKVVALRAGT